MSKIQNSSLFAMLVLVLPTACTSPVSQQHSDVDTPSLWSRLIGSPQKADLNAPLVSAPDAEVEQRWWTHFEDPVLDALISEALTRNTSLQIAKARVDEARANHVIAGSRLLPEINGVGSASRGNQGYATNNRIIGTAGANIQATWELDLFGRNQALTAQAAAIWESTEASRQAIRVSLLSDVAHTYFDLRNYERQVSLTKQNLETQKKTLELIQAQQQGALASDFDVQRAAAQVSSTEALIPALQTAYDASLNRLNVLLGYPPGTKDALLQSAWIEKPFNHQILVAAPAKVLATRPDIKVAERQYAASISATDAARAQMFPDISLTALFGVQTATSFPGMSPWNLGLNLVQPILNFGRIESQIDVADSQQKQAFLNYRQTVLNALENMENALSGYLHETTRNVSLTTGVAQNRKAAELARQQYSNGYTGLLDVLVAERNLLDAESSQASSDASLRSGLVSIYAAAGGGWTE